jgi:hypothetical protein
MLICPLNAHHTLRDALLAIKIWHTLIKYQDCSLGDRQVIVLVFIVSCWDRCACGRVVRKLYYYDVVHGQPVKCS